MWEGLGFTGGVCRESRRVIKTDMHHLRMAGKDRTGFMHIAADGDDILKRDVLDVGKGF